MAVGQPRLSEVTKYLIQPDGIVKTGWPAVDATCRNRLGIGFDRWQDGAGRLALAKRSDGMLAHTIGGYGMSIPRQVGKTYLWAGLTFGLSVNIPGLLTIWSAHHAKTHNQTFLAMQAFAKRSKVEPYVKRVFTGNGDEEVRFQNGSRILFGARERGFGRGIPGVDVLISDEGQILSERAMQDMLATLNTSRLGLHAYLGTPPKPGDMCEVWMRMRAEALSGESVNMCWIECGADDNANLDDRRQWAKANASHPHRTPVEAFLRLRHRLGDDGFRREALGIYDVTALDPVFDFAGWKALGNSSAESPTEAVLAVAVAQDRSWACIAVAGASASRPGATVVLCQSGRGVSWLAPKIGELVGARSIGAVVLAGEQAKTVKPDLVHAGLDFTVLPRTEQGASCAAFQEAVKAGTVEHVGQPELDRAVANARTRLSGESEQWDRRDTNLDDSPLVAAAAGFYVWGLQEAPVPAVY